MQWRCEWLPCQQAIHETLETITLGAAVGGSAAVICQSGCNQRLIALYCFAMFVPDTPDLLR